MAVRTREEIINAITSHLGDDTSDEAIAIIEDVTDTYSELESRANGDGKDWKAEAQRIEKEWRDKYVSRFKQGSAEGDTFTQPKPADKKDYSYDKLFK